MVVRAERAFGAGEQRQRKTTVAVRIVTMPINPVRPFPVRVLVAGLAYPNCAAISRTRRRVSALMRPVPVNALDAVESATFAAIAMSCNVTFFAMIPS